MIYFFFINKYCNDFLKTNLQFFLINCIYKVNCYKLLLIIINEITFFNILFYVTFCFFIAKKKSYLNI